MEQEAASVLDGYKLALFKRSNEEFKKGEDKIRDDKRKKLEVGKWVNGEDEIHWERAQGWNQESAKRIKVKNKVE